MNEQEMREEIERLRREVAEVREDRDQLHKMLCGMLPFEEIQLTEEDLKDMREKNVTIIDLLQDPRFSGEPLTNGVQTTKNTQTNHS
jgi:hypothetical protein